MLRIETLSRDRLAKTNKIIILFNIEYVRKLAKQHIFNNKLFKIDGYRNDTKIIFAPELYKRITDIC